MKTPYHSALTEALPFTRELEYYATEYNLVFKDDLTRSTSPYNSNLRNDTDAIYSELAWQAGYDTFRNRAGKVWESTFRDYLRSIDHFVFNYQKPIFLVMGKHMLNILKPRYCRDIKLFNRPCVLGMWNFGAEEQEFKDYHNFNTNEDILSYVSSRFNVVGDFSCGYGNLAKAMLDKGKKFICSDINGKCVYYLAKTYMGYDGK